jgi:uncharacterized protein (TIGR02452 family)
MSSTYNSKSINTELVEIFKDTLYQSIQYPHGFTTKHSFKDMCFLNFQIGKHRFPAKTGNLSVLNMDSVTALCQFKEGKSCVLNMASYKRPGGGVARGSKAQEEALFRSSNLAMSISSAFYPLDKSDSLYTQKATFFKDFYLQNMSPVESDVVTIAAINLNDGINTTNATVDATYSAKNDPEYVKLTYEKIRLMLTVATHYEVDNLILGAWGCGVFKNDPNFIAQAFKDVLNEVISERKFLNYFNNVVFAIINDHNSVSNNYTAFKNVLK